MGARSRLLDSVHFYVVILLVHGLDLIISFTKLCHRLPRIEIVLNLHYRSESTK